VNYSSHRETPDNSANYKQRLTRVAQLIGGTILELRSSIVRSAGKNG
jgi:hypothetical protein